ncbi:MinD-like ATPase involved in chromosome partitioning or flagellar assembly [Arthrobacter subterraneus]|uniref:MinD-like ATPase involved in chromosome partitioning or flagellar assembly n=1 Tax=Arthrobacter subterraneus TaxID=335973 RepID=A0A1G8MR92_9MICC|nr:ParA family protein [Arthrobacter subterraneus]SDI70491.1 MinD-like ATPase involved in chromosome partitioning or flagellar assembly [Arthrobacter subterraneus]
MTTSSQTEVSAFPHIRAVVRANGTGEVVIAGNSRPIDAPDETALRREAMTLITAQASVLARPVRVYTEGPEGDGELIVHPDGNIEEVAAETKGRRRRTATPPSSADSDAGAGGETVRGSDLTPPPAAPQPTDAQEPATQAELPMDSVPAAAPAETQSVVQAAERSAQPPAAPSAEAPTRRSLKETSFLISDPVVQPATQGFRGLMTRIGLRMDPSEAELAERADIHSVSQHWPGPRTIAVVNRKGGANKTPTVAALSAVFARYGGGGVLAWDNNENQGTLGWRTEQGPHTSSVLDLLRDKEQLLSPLAHNALLAHYVHHQTEDKYDVLRSDENDEGDHEISADEVDAVHSVAAKYYRMIIMDSGNTARAANWRAMIAHTNQLVIPTTTMEDRAEAAKLTLQTLTARDEHSAKLAEDAVVIISQWKPEDGDEARRIAAGFEPLVRAVVTVPYDPALKAGRIRHNALKPATQRAWLAAAAAVAKGL